ncbi:hypothetical protein KOR34_05690 [Posidoniimonas corsicana]|uniref:Heparinase II/III-like protein n=1 Tax=Posidoniimonas corsicana TaxID=1938618 RepID=A0A5C5VDF4_9BACT|nr:hypothetical protein [Posidoniimonas corsicana]TWT35675.1 hypothetical protein KOR34_05690 [Posidoniimonas corsicana]
MSATTHTKDLDDAASRNGHAAPAGPPPQRGISGLKPAQLWHPSAPGGLRSAWKEGDHADGWKRLGKLLADRSLPKQLVRGKKGSASPLDWGAATAGTPKWRADLGAKAGGTKVAPAIEQWLSTAAQRETDAAFVIESLWWAYELPTVAQKVEGDLWWRLVDALYEIATQAIDASLGEEPTAAEAFAHQALGGELPLVLSRQLPEAQPLRKLRKPAAAVLTDGVLALTDGEGMPTARVLDRLPQLLACWTRCRAWAEQSGKPCWSGDAETQYEWLVRQALRMSRGDGTLALTPAGGAGGKAMLDLALDLAGDVSDNAAAGRRLAVKAYDKIAGKADPPEPSVNSEWSGLSVLAAGWSGKTQRATVSYDGRRSLLEYSAGGSPLLSGEWVTEVRIDDQLLSPVDEWDEQCWFSDDDCDYLEIELDLEQGVRLQRQVLVSREDGVAYLADIVLTGGDKPRKIDVTTRLPMAADAAFRPEVETRDGWLVSGDKPRAGLAPAGLREWRTDPRVGELAQDGEQLVLRHNQHGRNLCCPLFLDSAPTRFAKQRTWRQLTVAEALHAVERDVAVAYRFQSGKDQWVTYRSLEKPANRTLIGHNIASECLFGRFLSTGEVDEFFEIEDD